MLSFQIVFEGVRGNGYRGDIAIDDIEFYISGGCSTFPTYASGLQLGTVNINIICGYNAILLC